MNIHRRSLRARLTTGAMALQEFVRDLIALRDHEEATPELSLRPPLQRLLEEAVTDRDGIVIPEARRDGRQPDFTVKTGQLLIGYVETKAPGADLTPDTEQLRAYIRGLDNLILTDYDTFKLYRRGECIGEASLGIESAIRRGSSASMPRLDGTRVQQLQSILRTFLDYRLPSVTRPADLARILARRTAILRDAIEANLQVEGGPFEHLYAFYRESLYPDMDTAVFADTAAQTVTYGLFLARLHHQGEEPFSVRNARFDVPENVQFLRSALRILADEDEISSDVRWIVDNISEVLRDCDISAIRRALEAKTEDAVLYFYEPFLEEYDPEERMDRGVYYTPVPLVQYITRNVNEILRTTFNRRLGFGDASVTILDPAVGTGTFLISIAHLATDLVIAEEGDAVANDFLRNDLIKRLVGFEVLPAPYTISHLRLAAYYKSREVPVTGEDRFRVYITNTVSAPTQRPGRGQHLPILQSLVDEVLAADHVKTEEPILVIIGNPPYDRNSRFNRNEYIESLMNDFRRVDNMVIDEENKKSLNDDYVKFFRWSLNKLLELETSYQSGILAFVSNSSYLDGIAFPGMRKWMLDHFDDIYVFNLHGNRRAAIRGRVDENVFIPVKAGISITIAVRTNAEKAVSCRVHYKETRGTRQEKFDLLHNTRIADETWTEVSPRSPSYAFSPDTAGESYGTWPSLPRLFKAKISGVQTSRDGLVVGFDADSLRRRIVQLDPESGVSDEDLRRHYDIRDGGGFTLAAIRSRPPTFDPQKIHRYLYRELDYRYIYFEDRLIARPRHAISDHMVSGDNIALISPRQRRGDGQSVTVSDAISDLNVMGSGVYVYPRYLFHDAAHATSMHHGAMLPNIADELLATLSATYASAVSCDDAFDYIFGVLASRFFGQRFGDAWRRDHPKVPFPVDEDAFRAIAVLGAELRTAQLFQFTNESIPVRVQGNGASPIASPQYDAANKNVILAGDLTLGPIEHAVWAFKMGQHFVLEEYIKARVDLVLSRQQMTDLRRVAASISASIAVLDKLDKAVEDLLVSETLPEDVLFARMLPEEQIS